MKIEISASNANERKKLKDLQNMLLHLQKTNATIHTKKGEISSIEFTILEPEQISITVLRYVKTSAVTIL